MVFKHSSIARSRRTAAFSLVELMVSLSIGLMVLAAATVLWAYASKTTASLLNYVELSTTSKNALDRISQTIRNASAVESFSTNQMVLWIPRSDNTTNTDKVTFTYDAATQKLTRTKGTEKMTLLTECSYFEFKVFTRVPIDGTENLNPTTTTATAKVVQMKWNTSRKLTGDQNTSQSLISSRVVMRSK